MNSNINEQQSTDMNNNCNGNQPCKRTKYLKKKPHKFYHRIRSFGNSLYQPLLLKKHMNDTQTFSMFESCLFKKNDNQSHIRSNKDPTLTINDYSHVSNEIFKEKILDSLSNENDRKRYIELFNNDEIFIFSRQLTQSINKLNYLNLQYDQWMYYHQLGMKEGIWHGRVSKKMALVNSMCVSYGRTKALIQRRQIYFRKKILDCQYQLEEFKKQAPISIDIQELDNIIYNFIQRDQYRLRIEFERQRQMLKMDAQDHEFVNAFYELNPRQTEILSAKVIWKATQYEQSLQYELTIFKKWMSLPTISMTLHTMMKLGLTKINELFTLILTNKVLFNTLSTTHIDTMLLKELVSESMNETILLIEKNIQIYNEAANVEKTKILNQKHKFKKLPTVENVLEAIGNRQQNMIECIRYHTEQTIKIIFPE
ncbi:unnamed protein product [Rotaria socialis]|uniref:Uncharacterized protein n=1 Tax=Rotaria socialis TaxID=392032 RepID=A0A817RB68_9BILA|nr:unnamed protein product [Rotaria socialis]CAF3241068.1 unnamed protein product [Rotaria socialis]CAF3713400.1 unnamed protein product [Rotaria socialis]CAF4416756.1 unnamed protein product [Rotaria socialis]CAF4453887.1 unnamed protein product [Rotaria socialis]